jgi:Ca2+-transporting ATPase
MLVLTVSVSFFSQIALVYVPLMQSIFQTAALDLSDLGVILGLAATSFCLHEARRGFERRLDSRESFATVTEEMA